MNTVSNGPSQGQDTDPSSDRIVISAEDIKTGDEAMDAMDELLARPEADDEDPPTSRTRHTEERPLPTSALAIRINDGGLLLSLEDAEGVDLSGRTIVRCLLLTEAEAAFVKATALDAHDDIAARLIGGLPRVS